jgi:glycosyltransferase involved in cell wall biosynthesis
MRVDLIITELFVGGAERGLTELALALHHRGERVRVASIAPLPVGEQAQLVQRLRSAGIEVHSVEVGRTWKAFAAYRTLRRWLAQDRPDVVQTMLYHANVLGTAAARSAGVPHCVGGIRVAEPNRWRLSIERQAVRRMDAVVCVSESVRKFAEETFGSVLPAAIVISNSIDVRAIDVAQPASWQAFGWPEDAQVLLYVGRLHPQKGLDVLAEAIEPLLAKHSEMRCLLVGDGPMRPQMEKVALRYGSSRFQLAGWRADALSLLKASRLVVLPSRYEGMPNVVLEAMAAGKPVAACRVEGVAELLGETVDQQSCAPGDAAALALLIDQLWSNRSLDCLGENNRSRAVFYHAPETMADRYQELYRSLKSAQSDGK